MQERGRVTKGYRLSPQQNQVWRLQQDSQAYTAQCAILIEGDIESEALEAALRKIMRKHEILRTSLGWTSGVDSPIQVILENPPLPYRSVDLSYKPSEDLEGALSQLFTEEARPFDLNHSLLVRFCLSRFSASTRVLLLSLHSLCADSWTLRNLFREISRFYAAELEGKELPDDAVQYLQFSEWQNELLQEKSEEAGKRHQERRSPVPDLVLPLEFRLNGSVEAARRRFSPESCASSLDSRITDRIEAVANACNCSVSGFLLACWQILLWWHTGEEEIVTECLFDGRQFDELHDALGLFARYTPAQGTLVRGLQFDEVVERTMKALRAAYDSQEYFLCEMANGQPMDRTNAIGFEYEEWPHVESVGAMKFSYWKQRCYIDRFKLKLCGHRKTDGLTIEVQYDPAVFSRESIELIQERYLRLVESAVADEKALIGDFEVLGRKELDRLLIGWNRTEKDVPANECIHDLFARQAERTPESPALIDDRKRLSYRELNRRANRIGHYLQGLGVGPETVVGVCLGRSVEMIVALMGVLKAGGAYLPLDPESPPDRLGFMLEDACVGVVLTQRESEKRLPVFWGQTICLDEEWARIDEESECEPESEVEPENPAYMIYTSGSTGRPKGVMVRHRGLVNYTLDICRQLGLLEGEGKRLQFATVSTITADLGNTCIYPSLLSGGCLHILSYEAATDGMRFEEYLRREPIEVLKIVPSHLSALLGSQPKGVKMLPSRYLILGGEALSFELAEQIKERGEGCEVINHYGPTETTIGSLTTRVKVEEGNGRSGGSVPIGRPIANTESYVLDRELNPAPVGVKGELYLGGEGVARGYWRRPDFTAERFIPNLFGRKGGERLYRTGDVVRQLSDGRVEFVGRADNQVKVRGYRVELGEIEAALKSHPGVREAVVMLRGDEFGQKRLVGYVVGRHEKTIKGKPRRRLPNGMAIVEQNRNETEYLYEEIFKRKRYFKHGISLPEGGCVFDVGANIGLFTLFVSQNRKGLRVYAFEPLKPIYETLQINAQLYGGTGVKLFQLGVGEEARKEWFTYYRGYSMMSGESRYATVSDDIEVIKRCMVNDQAPEELLREADEVLRRRFEEERYRCEVRRLTDVMREEKIERVDLLKVDVQRAEMDVLKGLEEEDWKKIDQLVMEVHDKEGGETEGRLGRIKELLTGKGYEVAVEQDEALNGTDRYNLYAKRNGGVKPVGELEWREVNVNDTVQELTEEELKRFLREKLPEYMTPAAVVVLEDLPLTRNGKLDRGALPEPEEVKKRAEADGSEHWNAYEELLGGIWKEVLKIEKVRPGDNFFELGGHSLLATQVASRVRATFGIEIGVMSIFDEPTIRGLAGRIEDAMSRGVKDKAPPLVRAERDEALPLSFAQERLWFLDQLLPNNLLYNLPRAVRLEGRLDIRALERVINEIVRRHEALRTRFEVEEGEPVQVIDEWEPRGLEVEDLTSLPGEEREEEVRRITREEARTGFDLSRGPLLRVKVLKLGEDEHVLFCTMHHIVSDGWSTGILIREVGALYQAYSAGEPSPLAELTFQYADFSVWQREWLQGEALQEELEYWRKQLAGIENLKLPTDHPRPAILTYRGASRRFVVEREVSEKLRELCQREGVTLFMALMAAFKVVLMRYGGVEDVSIGTVIANRTRKEVEGLIGFFANTLVLRTDLSGNPSFRESVKREREVALGAYARQEAPFEKLVEEINPDRDLSRSPLFQVMLALQNAGREVLELKGVKLRGGGSEAETASDVEIARFDLTVSITDLGHELAGVVNYSRDLFEERTIERLMNHYTNVLYGIVKDSEQPICSLNLLSDQEREQIIVEWNETGRPYPEDRRIHEMFEQQVESAPEAVALIYEDRQLSYAELNARANQLAHYLRRLGVGPERLVGICMERGPEMVIGLVATLKAGGAYLPLDPAYPAQRMAFMMEEAEVKALLTQQHLLETLPANGVRVVTPDVEWGMVVAESVENPPDSATAENLVYAIYTSGSTGRPKGVLVSHRQVVNFFTAMDAEIEPDLDSVWLAVTSISFDISVLEMLWTLARGFQVVIRGERNRAGDREGLSVSAQITRSQVSHLQCTPSMAKMLSMDGDTFDTLGGLRKLMVGGEPFPIELAERLKQMAGAEIRNMYGPTETTIWSATYRLCGEERNIPIGRPVANTQIYILDRALEIVPVGVAGELYIGGEGVVRGYLKQAELTGDRFLPDEFNREGGGRIYRTGDLARYRDDGRIEFLGRIDHQVKIRGYRIELGEIEIELGAHPGVRQCVVMAHEDETGEKRLVAYVVYEGESEPSVGELRSYLKERLPEYMAPWWFVRLGELPLTPNGKVDRRALPAPDVNRTGERDGYIAPRTLVEEIGAGIFEELLKPDRVGVRDNFFELGGHSLLAMKVVSRVRNAFGVEIGVRSVFEEPTVEGLAGRIERAMRAREKDEAPPLVRVKREAQGDVRLPLSFAQQRLWFIDRLEPGSSAYNVPGAVRLEGKLDLELLERVINEIVRRHETLRTRFEEIEGAPVQVIAEWQPRKLEVVDLTSLPPEEREAEVRRRIREEAGTGFDLSRGPLFRVKALILEEEQRLALFTIHHIVSDGWSMGILIKEVGALYKAYDAGEASPLPELDIQYGDYTVWQRQWLQGEILEKQSAYWKRQLAGAPSLLQLPTDRPRPVVPLYRGSYESFVLSPELSDRLKRLSRDEDVTSFMILLASFQLLLARYSREDRVVVGTPVAGRNRKETEGLIGFFVNTLVMVADLSANPTVSELLRQVRETAIGAFMHQDLPFEKLVEEVQPERNLSRQPLFQVMFAFQNLLEDSSALSNLGGRNERIEVENAKFELTLTIVEEETRMLGMMEYASDLYERESIVRLLGHLKRLLETVTANRERRVLDIPLLTEPEWEQILTWNRTTVEYAAEKCLHSIFTSQAERTPDNLAAVFEDQHLTYAELDASSNRLANRFKRMGVGPDAPVAICMDRSLSMIIGLLGILKAGGAYIPLDPEYPKERLALILDDAQAIVLLTQDHLAGELADLGQRMIVIDRQWEEISSESKAAPFTTTAPENLAYIIYTSGSTGRPKGVMIPHQAICNRILWMQAAHPLSETDKVLQKTVYTFDASIWEFFLPLFSGAQLVFAKPDGHSDPAYLAAVIAREGVSTLQLVPSMLQVFLNEPSAATCVSLRNVFCGGEALAASLKDRFLAMMKADLHNLYGPTEAAIDAASWSCKREPTSGIVPIGKPIANDQLFLVDERFQPVPIGVAGELHIGGVGLAWGYLNQPDLTAEKFLPDPFGEKPGARLYKTGDLARLFTDGNIEYLGRIDYQIKIRGQRIEPAEIENALMQAPPVRECVVIACEDEPGDKRLAAYITLKEGYTSTTLELRRFLRQRLPAFLVPSSFAILDSIPLSSNGKIDRQALPAPSKHEVELGGIYVAPSTPIENDVARIFREVLGIEDIGIYDDFFALGGHSLLVTQVVNRVNSAYQVKLPIRTLFDAPNVNDLVAAIVESQAGQLEDDVLSQVLAEIEEPSEN